MAGGVVSAAGLSQAVRVGATTRAPRRQITRAVAGPAAAGGVWVTVEKHVEWGQSVGVVGPRGWERGSPLHWHEGDVWEGEVAEGAEFKLAVLDDEGRVLAWERGPNRSLTPAEEGKPLRLQADFDVDEPSDANGPSEVGVDVAANASAELAPPAAPVGDGELPGWAAAAVWYQIYPLGFCDCPPTNDHRGDPVPRLRAVTGYVDHLQALGVGCVLFNPLCESDTHGYDTTDYKEVDRRLGTVEDMRALVEGLHAKGIRVVLDGVFNHTGRSHRAFQETASAGPARSKYANWYKIGAKPEEYEGWCTISWDESSGYGFAYDCWEGHPQLPQLNHSDRSVREHIFEVARFWLKDVGVDGWRLDVAHEISPDFWREFRKVCQEVKPDCLLVGEMIHGNYRGWVGGDRLHSGTNYQLARAMWSSLLERNYDELYTAIQRETKLYDGLTLLNFLSNHDVIRLASVLDQPQHYTLATASLMLLPGIPCFYYGDEFGVEGVPGGGVDDASGGDDALRTVMLDPSDTSSWPEVGKERLAITQAIVKVRQSFPVFTHGKLDVNGIAYGSTHFVFMRQYGSQVGIVAFNSSEQVAEPWPEVSVPLPDGAVFQDVWSPDLAAFEVKDGGKLYIGPLEPNSVRILIADSDPSKRPALMAAMPVFAPPATIASTGPPSTGSVPSPGDIRGGSAMPSA
mmetsp:Transcript_11509/g.29072  ORF Transcript_11509/g.29072 Transcript_11509/m.29072 type:complete len:685 (+) Transcript_11509:136-2190(+)